MSFGGAFWAFFWGRDDLLVKKMVEHVFCLPSLFPGVPAGINGCFQK